MRLSTVLDVARHDLRRRTRDLWGLGIYLAIPLVIGLLLKLAFGGGEGAGPRADLLVVDRDDSVLSGLLIGALAQGDEFGPIDATVAPDEQAARAALDRGEHTALLVVREGFERTILREEPGALELVVNPSERVLPQMVEETLNLLREAHFSLHRVAGGPLAQLVATFEGDGPPDELAIAAVAVRLRSTFEGLGEWVDPPRVDVVTTVEEPDEEQGGYAASLGFAGLALTSLLAMTVLFTAVGQSEDLWAEKVAGNLARLATTPIDPTAWVLGKLSGAGLLLGALVALGLLIARHGFGLSFTGAPLAVGWLGLCGAAIYAGLLVLQTLGRNQRAGSLIANLVTFPLLMLGGGFFPLETMPDSLAAVGRHSPLGFVIERLKAILAGEPPGVDLARDVALAVVLTGLLLALVRVRLRRFVRP